MEYKLLHQIFFFLVFFPPFFFSRLPYFLFPPPLKLAPGLSTKFIPPCCNLRARAEAAGVKTEGREEEGGGERVEGGKAEESTFGVGVESILNLVRNEPLDCY